MLDIVSRHWYILLSRGIVAIVLGIIAVVLPGITAIALALLFGAYALIDGVFAIAASLRMSHADNRWRWLLVEGILGVLFGLVALAFPGLTLLLLVVLLAAWAIVTGIAAITTAWHLRRAIAGEWLWIFSGILSVLFGIFVLFVPGAGLFAVVYTFAFYVILTGVTFVGLAFRMKRAAGVAAPPVI